MSTPLPKFKIVNQIPGLDQQLYKNCALVLSTMATQPGMAQLEQWRGVETWPDLAPIKPVALHTLLTPSDLTARLATCSQSMNECLFQSTVADVKVLQDQLRALNNNTDSIPLAQGGGLFRS